MEEASSSSSSLSPSPRAVPMQIAVLGVPLSASEEDLKNHFGRYGQVLVVLEDAHGKPQDSDSKQAFVVFADSASAMRASDSREKNNHIILGKLVEVSRFSNWFQGRRIEVNNLPPGTTSSQFRAYFEQFGTVTEAVVGPDGSGYVVFKCDESLRKVLRKKLHLFYGLELQVRRESPHGEAFLVANAAQHESAGATSSTTPYAHGVAYIPTSPVLTDSTRIATTPYDALYTPSYNPPTTAIPHAYSVPTPPFGTPYTSSYNRPISVTTYAHGAPSISPYGVPATSFYNWPTITTPHVSSAPTPPLGTLYMPFYNRPTSASPHAYSKPHSKTPQIEDTTLNLGEKDNDNIDGHKVDVKQAELKETRTAEPSRNSSSNANVPNDKQIFVGRLPTDITYGEFRAYFEKFGPITYAFVKTDRSNRSRGFGFVTFETEESADKVLMYRLHMMRPDKIVEVQKAIPKIEGNIRRDNNNNDNGVSSSNNIIDGHKAELKETWTAESSRNSSSNTNVSNDKMIFVGGLPWDITDDEFRAYFEKFGPITNALVRTDKNINRPRGFGFVTFETEESAHEVLKNQFHEMRPDNKKVEVKKAIPKIEGNVRRDNNNDNNGYSSNNNNINTGGKYNPEIKKFPSDEYTHAVNYPVQFCDNMYPYTWYTPMLYGPIGYGPMGYGPMGYGPMEYGGWNCTNPNITYDSHMQPGNIQHGGFCNNLISGHINLNFSGGGNSGAVDSANEGVSRNINTAEAEAEGTNINTAEAEAEGTNKAMKSVRRLRN